MIRVMEVLNEYESSLKLPDHKSPGEEAELEEFFTWDRDIIEGLSVEQCGSAAYRLNQYAFYIQREFNRETSRIRWAKAQLNLAVSDNLGTYSNLYNHEAKIVAATKENLYATALADIIRYAEQRVDRLTYLSNGIRNLADNMLSIQRAKIQYKREQS